MTRYHPGNRCDSPGCQLCRPRHAAQRRSDTWWSLGTAVVVGICAFILLLALTACDTNPLPTPQPDPGMVCTTYATNGDGPPVVECQRFPAPFPGVQR